MNVVLTPALKKFVEDEVRSGTYLSAADVIREGLRELKRKRLPKQPRNRAELVELLSERAAGMDRGKKESGATLFRFLRHRAERDRRRA